MRKYIPASYKNRTPSKELNNHLYLIEILKKLSKPNETYEKIVDGHTCTIYVTKEPCPMCTGAIFWGNVRRVVYGLSQEGLYEMIGEDDEDVLDLPCRELFEKGHKTIEVIGPILEEEARRVHAGFWL